MDKQHNKSNIYQDILAHLNKSKVINGEPSLTNTINASCTGVPELTAI